MPGARTSSSAMNAKRQQPTKSGRGCPHSQQMRRSRQRAMNAIKAIRQKELQDAGWHSRGYLPSVAEIIQDSLLHFDGKRYRLSAWVIMPNHVHLLLTPCGSRSLSRIIKDMKSFTSHEANKVLGRRGRLWMQDYFDRYVRNAGHCESAVAYIESNPVKARLCTKPEDWPFSSARFRQ